MGSPTLRSRPRARDPQPTSSGRASLELLGVQRILVPLDLEEGSLETFREALDLAHLFDADLLLLHALEREDWGVRSWGLPSAYSRAVGRLGDLLLTSREEGVAAVISIRTGSPGDVILSAAREQRIDLVVMRAERRSAWRWLLGRSVVSRLMGAARCSIWLAPPRVARSGWHRRAPTGLALRSS